MGTKTIVTVLIAVFWFTGCEQKNAASDVKVPPPPKKTELQNLQTSGDVPAKEAN